MDIDPVELQELAKSAKAARRLRHVVETQELPEAPAPRFKPLTESQEKLAQLLVKYGGDARRAYTEAGYSTAGKTWEVEALKLARLPKIKARVEDLRRELAGQAGIDETWVLTQGKKFVERAYLLGDLKGGKDLLELIAKILGIMRERDKSATVPALMQQFNFLGADSKADLQRLARAANVQVIDVDSAPAEPVKITDMRVDAGTSTSSSS